MLTNQATYRQMAGQFLAGYPFIYFSGILALVGGLAILNAHHDWTRDWRSLITLLGLDHDGRRRVPHHRAAVRQLRRHGGPRAQRILHRAPASSCSRSAASSPSKAMRRERRSARNRRQDHEQARHLRRSGHPEGHHRAAAGLAQGLLRAGGGARAARAGARDRARRDRPASRRCRSTTPPASIPIRTSRSTWRRASPAPASNG